MVNRFRVLVALLVLGGAVAWLGVAHLVAQEAPPPPPVPPQADRPSDPPPPPRPAPPQTAPAPLQTGPGAAGTLPGGGPGTSFAPQATQPMMAPALQRFHFKIEANAPLKDLLPPAPQGKKSSRPVTGDDLTQVPEVEFQAPLSKNGEALKNTAHQIAKINHLNGKKNDAFMEALRGERLDLAGMPFTLGDACRTKGDRSRHFTQAVAMVRGAMQQRGVVQALNATNFDGIETTPFGGRPVAERPGSATIPGGGAPMPATAVATFVVADRPGKDHFWEQYQTACAQEDRRLSHLDRVQIEGTTVARIAALMQILAPETPAMRLGLVKYLAGTSHVEATKALAKLAIFSTEDEVRHAAVDALKVRRERDYTEVLLQGLRYPWPKVARRAADAIVRLERSDLIPQLVDVLDEADPRAPTIQEVSQKKVPVVREMVRVNHHRNCLLCHAPGNTGSVSADTLTAAVPIPTEPLPSPSDGYRGSHPDVLVRLDVTYLRQDFSAFQAVADANPWPEMQRFDFMVRTRELTEEEADAYRQQFARREAGQPSPYQKAALAALREMTGKDAEPTPEAWRRLLKLPEKPARTALAR